MCKRDLNYVQVLGYSFFFTGLIILLKVGLKESETMSNKYLLF